MMEIAGKILVVLESLPPWERDRAEEALRFILALRNKGGRLTVLMSGTSCDWVLSAFFTPLGALEIPLYVYREDLARRGIPLTEVSDGITPVRRNELTSLLKKHRSVLWV